MGRIVINAGNRIAPDPLCCTNPEVLCNTCAGKTMTVNSTNYLGSAAPGPGFHVDEPPLVIPEVDYGESPARRAPYVAPDLRPQHHREAPAPAYSQPSAYAPVLNRSVHNSALPPTVASLLSFVTNASDEPALELPTVNYTMPPDDKASCGCQRQQATNSQPAPSDDPPLDSQHYIDYGKLGK